MVALREGMVDLQQRVHPRERLSAPVTIVEIDERSLAAHGQWPWPRSQVAALIARVGEAAPAAIGLDLLFPEPDRLSPASLAGACVVGESCLADSVEAQPALREDLVRRQEQGIRIAACDPEPRTSQQCRHGRDERSGGQPAELVAIWSENASLGWYGTDVDPRAYAVGTISCNIGTDNLLWISNTNQHPEDAGIRGRC